jgi:hypothetical protein
MYIWAQVMLANEVNGLIRADKQQKMDEGGADEIGIRTRKTMPTKVRRIVLRNA